MHHHLHRLFRAAPQGHVTIDSRKSRTAHGFTIVELLVVIVVIGILAAITIVAYTGISSKATVASLASDLTNTSQQLKILQVTNGAYPTANNCPTPGGTEICLKASGGTVYVYTSTNSTNPQSFALTATKSGTSYIIADNTTPGQISANPTNLNCPTGFIPVPGSITYGTADFCVMKYEAKTAGSNVPVSTAASTPFVSVNQTNAAIYSQNVVGCTGCHLITEAEYLTIAQNVLSVASNWSSGTVGSGYIYSGHNDNALANSLAADPSDANGYAGTGSFAGDNSVANGVVGNSQRRTLTLSNAQVIWDLAGNVWEWTSGTSTTGQPGVNGGGLDWREWTAVTNPGAISPNPSASATGIAGASSWNSGKGIGVIYSSADEAGLRGCLRGGTWYNGTYAGVLLLFLPDAPSDASMYTGFRVSR